MHVDRCINIRNGKTYRRVLLRQGWREKGKIKMRTIANLSHCTEEEIEAIDIALKNKHKLPYLKKIANGQCVNGKKVGAVAALHQVAQQLGITKTLGFTHNALLILWLVLARVIEKGSRLSAVRAASFHTVSEIIGIEAFNEDDLYLAMDWLCQKRGLIEQRLFRQWEQQTASRRGEHIFLYDVTSSYLEGQQNELADWGYNRDKKNGKKQIVYGLLTDSCGEPLAVEVFKGNTKDNHTLGVQLEKIKHKFGCKYVTMVGDKGMIKSVQIDEIHQVGFHYITSITKDQIRSLLKKGILQMELFDETVCEVEDTESHLRYIFRRNPFRAEQIKQSREEKIAFLEQKMQASNRYLLEHGRAKVAIQKRDLEKLAKKLKIELYVSLQADDQTRHLRLEIDTKGLEEAGRLDGCYVIKTDLPKEAADKETIHSRYKGLSEVEWAFRMEKSELDVRPIYVRLANRTMAHILITMLAYKIERHLRKAWADMNITVSEGIAALEQITTNIITIGETKTAIVPKPDGLCEQLLNRIHVKLPEVLAYKQNRVNTRKKLTSNRRTR